jgi:hypothetical protein
LDEATSSGVGELSSTVGELLAQQEIARLRDSSGGPESRKSIRDNFGVDYLLGKREPVAAVEGENVSPRSKLLIQ